MNTPHSLSNSRPGPACAAFEPLLPLAPHGMLEPAEAEQLHAHLAGCAHCRARLAAYDRLDTALRQRFEQVALPSLHTEEIMKEIQEQEEAGAFETPAETPARSLPAEAPALPTRRRAGQGPRRVISWVAAIAAVLLIALLTTALIASRHPSTTGTPSPAGTAAPAAASGVYFSATTAGSSPQTFIYALNPTNGSVRWRSNMPAGVSGSPVLVDHSVLYVLAQDVNAANPSKDPNQQASSAKNAVYALQTSDGKEIWHTPVGNVPAFLFAVNGAVYVETVNGGIFALNASDGAVKWHITPGDMVNVMQVVDGLVYAGVYHSGADNTVTGKLVAFNASDGSVKWSFPLQGQAETIQVSGGYVAVVDTQVTPDKTNGVNILQWFSLLNASDGLVKWRYQGNPSTLGAAFLEQNTIYVTLLSGSGKEQSAGTLQALNASDGSLRWQKLYANFNLLRPDQGLGGGNVYLAAGNTVLALNAQTGTEVWHAQIGTNAYFDRLTDGTLIAEAQTGVYALNAADGSLLWRSQLAEGAQLGEASGQIVYGSAKNIDPQQHWLLRVFAINARTGKELWHVDFTSGISEPIVG